jgi:hypothetical protein
MASRRNTAPQAAMGDEELWGSLEGGAGLGLGAGDDAGEGDGDLAGAGEDDGAGEGEGAGLEAVEQPGLHTVCWGQLQALAVAS